jgi:hypothetical protein
MLLEEGLIVSEGRVVNVTGRLYVIGVRPGRDFFLAWLIGFWVAEAGQVPPAVALYGD